MLYGTTLPSPKEVISCSMLPQCHQRNNYTLYATTATQGIITRYVLLLYHPRNKSHAICCHYHTKEIRTFCMQPPCHTWKRHKLCIHHARQGISTRYTLPIPLSHSSLCSAETATRPNSLISYNKQCTPRRDVTSHKIYCTCLVVYSL